MTLKFFKLLQRNIEDDLNIIIPSDTDFLDELVEDCLPLLKGCVLIGACPSEQIAAIIFSFLVFLLNLLQLVLCSGQGIGCVLMSFFGTRLRSWLPFVEQLSSKARLRGFIPPAFCMP